MTTKNKKERKTTIKHEDCKFGDNKIYGLACLKEIVEEFDIRITKLEKELKQ